MPPARIRLPGSAIAIGGFRYGTRRTAPPVGGRAIVGSVTSAEHLPVLGFEDFLRGEAVASRRHELVGGRAYAMSGGTERHDLTAGLVYEALAPGARAAGCRPFTANRLLRAGAAAYYPGVMVVCGPAAHRLYETAATVLVEVASPSTADVDRREKAAAYAGLPTLAAYLLVDPDRRRIEMAVPGANGLTWDVYGPGSVVVTPVGTLDLDALYDTVDAAATT